MFPSVKNKEDSAKEKVKQKQWDQRGGKVSIPQYSPIRDKHTVSYKKSLMANSTSKLRQSSYEESKNKPIKRKTYFEKKLQLMVELKQIHPTYIQDIKSYEDTINKSGAPNFYSFFELLALKKTQDPKGFIHDKVRLLKQKASAYHRISTAVRARDQCLQRLHKTLLRLKQPEILKIKEELKQEISHLRLLTTNVIDQMKNWRNELGEIDEKAIYYADQSKNYLIELLNDNKFIFNSELSSAVNFGEKNDPFVLAPLKKALNKEESPYLAIFATDKDLSYYQKYMDYLAGEKAYQLNMTMSQSKTPAKKMGKSQSVNKIYGAGGNKSKIQVIEESKYDESDSRAFQIQKNREDRLKKNQQKINAIKNIYETVGQRKGFPKTERKMAETDIQDKIESNRQQKIKKMRESDDNGFDGLVKLRMDFEKVKAKSKRKGQSNSSRKEIKKQQKSEEKMIDNLRDIQETLKNKLQLVQKQNSKLEQSASFTSSKFKYSRKNNDELMKELKLEIIQKIQKQNAEKEKIRKKRKEEEEKALEEIKMKMKKQMEEKLEQKKKQKILQREQLEKRLKEEEQRLNNQREMELQLQLKLHKEREMRELQKIRREALEKQKQYKEELEKEQRLRKQRQQAIEREKRQKQKLLQELKKKELKQQIEEELRKQLMEKKKVEDQQSAKNELEALKKQKQQELSKQIELLKLKEKQQISILEKQAELREKMLKLKKDEQELKRKEVEQLMKNVIQKDKQDLERQALSKRVTLEQQMRNSIKQKMLEQYRAQRQNQIEMNRTKREKEMQQEIYRDKIREKIEREMRMDAINRTKKDMDEKQAKKYELRTKLQNVKANIQINHAVDRNKIEEDVKKQLIQKVIFDKQAQRQNAKTALRSQFERELLSSALPQIYETKDSFLLKNTQHLLQDNHLQGTIDKYKPTNQKPNYQQIQGTKKSGIKDVRSLITNEQLQIYSKQKQKISEIKQERKNDKPKKYQEEQQGFELMNTGGKKNYQGSEDEYDIKIIRKEKPKKVEEEDKYEKKKGKKKRKRQEESEQDSEEVDRIRKKKKNKKKKRRASSDEEFSSMDSEDKLDKRKQKAAKKKKVVEDSQSEERERQSPIKRKVEFGTSEEESKPKRKSSIKMRKQSEDKPSQSQKSRKNVVVHFDSNKKSTQKQPNFAQIEPITIKTDKKNAKQTSTNSKFTINLQAIPEAELDQYIQSHFSNLPEDQLDILAVKREQLYRKLINQLTFCLLLGYHDNKLGGIAIAYHDRSRSDIRKFHIVHMGTYKTDDLKDFIISITNYIFKKDPCDEIEFNYEFDEQHENQLTFSTEFNKWFDKFGNVYQKKADNSIYQRKYVLKRQFNQKCDVVLGGVNKNTFRNIFSVYSGVMMSDSDLLQFKEELVDVIAPEDDVSYAIMIAELFRTYLTPDQAEALKGKVKQFAKLKELLVLVVMLQKKKVKMEELKLSEFKSVIQLNMRLMSQGKDVVKYAKDPGVDLNRVFYCELSHGFNLPFNFQTTSLPVQAKQNQIRQISYFRLAPLPPYKLHIMKSSIYNGQMNILPTQNSKYKLFIMNAQEYVQMRERQESKLDLFMYIRLFIKNVKSHNVAVWKYVWMPEMTDKGAWNIREFRSFLTKDIYCHDSVNISYRQFLPGALIIEPQHRDLVITPPFIIGIMSMTLEQITQGSPLYARLIDVDALRTIQIQE